MKNQRRYRWPAAVFILAFGLAVLTPRLEAQYFGRNKVQYERFDFKIIKTKHFDIYYYPEFKNTADDAARMAERWYARLSRMLNHELKGRQPLILYSSSPHFQQTTVLSGLISEGTGGVTESFKRRIIMPIGSSPGETDHIVGHELVHAFQYDMMTAPGGGPSPGGMRVPDWFIEGMAEYLSVGSVDAHTAMWMRDVTQRKKLPTIKKLDNPYKYFPYRYGQALWAYVTGRWGDEMVSRMMKGVGRVGDLESATTRILGVSFETLSKDWLEAYKKAYDPLVAQTQLSDPSSRVLFKGTEMNPYNVSPAVSPDGKQIIFLSTRDLFSIDLYLADAKTGKIKKKITETAINPEFESLQFIKSAGAWDTQGKRFVFGAISKGQPILTFFDMEKEKVVEEIPFANLGEIYSPTWSPDGRLVAFAALAEGKTDLYLYDLGAKTLKQLTDDLFGDFHPAWSPDGRTIAFVTDRFGTDFSLLRYGDYELALLDPLSGKIDRVQGFMSAKNINPQWSPDSQSLYFLADPNGKSDVYRLDLKEKKIYQVTNLYTGISGITDLSPAISVAQGTGELVYSLYDAGEYSIYSIDKSETLRGNPDLAQFGGKLLSVLPPREQPGGALLGLLKNPLFGLPEQSEFPVSEYKPKLGLDYVSSPQIGVGVDRFGTYTGGGVALFWTDMLGYHTLGTIAQTSSRLKDLTALVTYQNSKRRLNWGGAMGRIPYVYGYYSASYGEMFGEPVYIEQDFLSWQINYELQGFFAYPFNSVRRLEFRGGVEYIDFDREVITQAFSLIDNVQIYREIEKLPSAESLSFAYAGAALVYDSSLFGATGPIIGQSYVLELTPTIGSIYYYSVLADYRHYFMPVRPFTLAFRILHYGRYGKGAEDSRLYPIYIGYEYFVRGYDNYYYDNYASITLENDPLAGSKILVANAELRFPLFRVLGIGKGYYGILPIDMLFFYDWGVAWTDKYNPSFLNNGSRKPISSAGVGLRMNVFGYLILGLNAVKPFNGLNRDWRFQISFYPGF